MRMPASRTASSSGWRASRDPGVPCNERTGLPLRSPHCATRSDRPSAVVTSCDISSTAITVDAEVVEGGVGEVVGEVAGLGLVGVALPNEVLDVHAGVAVVPLTSPAFVRRGRHLGVE